MERSLAILLPEGLRVRAAALPPKDDPDSLLAREGPEALRAVVDAAVPALESVIRRAASHPHATPWEKSDAVAQVAPMLALVADPVERGAYERQLALAIGVADDEVRALVRREGVQRRGLAPSVERESETVAPAPRAPLTPEEVKAARWAAQLARQWLDHPVLAREVDPEAIGALLPVAPWNRLLPALAELCDAEQPADVEALCTLLDEECATALRGIALTEAEPLELERARVLQTQTLDRFRKDRYRAERREQHRGLMAGEIDGEQLLAKAQHALELRRAQGPASGPVRPT
jgi:DNA primase